MALRACSGDVRPVSPPALVLVLVLVLALGVIDVKESRERAEPWKAAVWFLVVDRV